MVLSNHNSSAISQKNKESVFFLFVKIKRGAKAIPCYRILLQNDVYRLLTHNITNLYKPAAS